jgi:hypothetical protein
MLKAATRDDSLGICPWVIECVCRVDRDARLTCGLGVCRMRGRGRVVR